MARAKTVKEKVKKKHAYLVTMERAVPGIAARTSILRKLLLTSIFSKLKIKQIT